MAIEFARSQSILIIIVLGAMLSEIHAKTDQHCRDEDCLAIDMQCFAGVHFERDFDRVLLQLGLYSEHFEHCGLNTERASESETFELLMKKLCKI